MWRDCNRTFPLGEAARKHVGSVEIVAYVCTICIPVHTYVRRRPTSDWSVLTPSPCNRTIRLPSEKSVKAVINVPGWLSTNVCEIKIKTSSFKRHPFHRTNPDKTVDSVLCENCTRRTVEYESFGRSLFQNWLWFQFGDFNQCRETWSLNATENIMYSNKYGTLYVGHNEER